MEHSWHNAAELARKLRAALEVRHPDEVTELRVAIEGDLVVLVGEVASEGCRSDAKRLALSFDGVFKVANRLEVAAFLTGASDTADEDDFFDKPLQQSRGPGDGFHGRDLQDDGTSEHERMPSWSDIVRRSTGERIEGPGIEYGSFQPEAAPEPVEVSRFPTIERSGEVRPGASIDIIVGLSTDAAAHEQPILIGSFPSDWSEIDVSVQITGEWLATAVPQTGTITLRRSGDTTSARFTCSVAEDYVAGSPAVLLVSYLHGTRICGHFSIDLATAKAEQDVPAAEPVPASPDRAPGARRAVTIVPDALGPAMSVMISVMEGDRQMWMWTAFGPGGASTGSSLVELGAPPKIFADTLLQSCPNLPANSFRRTMRGVGEAIWRKAPAGFQSAYARCRATIGPGFAIQFSTDDPHIPWEMMKPDLEEGAVDHLYIEHPVARWPLNPKHPMRAAFGDGEIVSFVPEYSSQRLSAAAQEGDWIRSTLGAIRMNPKRDEFLNLLDGNYEGIVRMLHFAGHGRADTGSNDGGIDLEDGPVGLMDVYQSSVRLGVRDGPLLVLNACEASAGAEMLGMNTGWGAAVAASGFGGLIAPLWAVQDSVAFTVAQDCLPDLVNSCAPLGEAVRKARLKNANASVAALAYLAHGDVMASFVRS